MATLNTLSAAQGGSDSEDDSDFVPDNDASADLGSDSSEGDEHNEHRVVKKMKLPDTVVDGDGDVGGDRRKVEQVQARASLWAKFEASVASSSTSHQGENGPKEVKMVLIERKFRFAGEDVIEVKEVPEDSEEAKQWPRATTSAMQSVATSDGKGEGRNPEHARTPLPTDGGSQIMDRAVAAAASASTIIVTPVSADAASTKAGPTESPKQPPPPRGAGRRRPKATLSALAAASSSAAPKKLTMLEKSKMDWNAHLASSSGIQDELGTNRKSGTGYLDKVDFLDRVGARREEELEKEKGKRKR